MLLDLIETRGDKGKRFAAAKDSGFFDIARGLRPHRNREAINGRQTPSWAWQLIAVAGS
jgi:hypothetical protein